MMLHFTIICLVFIRSQGSLAAASSNELNFRISLTNKTISNIVLEEFYDMICKCHSKLSYQKDYVYSPGIGLHKLHTDKKKWNEARIICNEEGGHLAIINSVAGETVSSFKC